MSAVAPYRVHRLIQDLVRDPAATRTFNEDRAPVYAAYGIQPDEQAALDENSLASMCALGVHPNLQMKWKRVCAPAPPPAGKGPLDAYLDRLKGA